MAKDTLACLDCPFLDTPHCTPECRPDIIAEQDKIDLSLLCIPMDDGCRWVAPRPASE